MIGVRLPPGFIDAFLFQVVLVFGGSLVNPWYERDDAKDVEADEITCGFDQLI